MQKLGRDDLINLFIIILLSIYNNENFIIEPMKELEISTVDIESLFLKVCNSDQPLVFGVIYRPPSGNIMNYHTQFEKKLNKLSSYENNIVCGDFNINLLKNDSKYIIKIWEYLFWQMLYSNYFLANPWKSWMWTILYIYIDNIFVSNVDNVINSGILHEIKVSHQFPNVCIYDIQMDNENENKKSLPLYNKTKVNKTKVTIFQQFTPSIVHKLITSNIRQIQFSKLSD